MITLTDAMYNNFRGRVADHGYRVALEELLAEIERVYRVEPKPPWELAMDAKDRRAEPEVPAAVPCPEGFHWIAQTFASCDRCGLPAWDHEGIAVPDVRPAEAEGALAARRHVLRRWHDGERLATARKWESSLIDLLVGHPAGRDRCDPLRKRHREPHIGCTLTDKINEETPS